MIGCKRPFSEKIKKSENKNLKTERKNRERKKSEKEKIVSCVLVCDVVRFDLEAFSGFLAVFCALCGKLLGLYQENGLERLKMRFWKFTRVRVCV